MNASRPDEHLPRSPACERNRDPILRVLERHFPSRGVVLEIGAGTGEHAVYFAGQFPGLTWTASDRRENHPGIRAWMEHANLPNLNGPVELDVLRDDWPDGPFDAVFSANTAHIMGFDAVRAMIAGVGRSLTDGGLFCLYGPFHYGGEHTAESNRRFHRQLQDENPAMGIRDAGEIAALADAAGMDPLDDVAMPANNRTLVFIRRSRGE